MDDTAYHALPCSLPAAHLSAAYFADVISLLQMFRPQWTAPRRSKTTGKGVHHKLSPLRDEGPILREVGCKTLGAPVFFWQVLFIL